MTPPPTPATLHQEPAGSTTPCPSGPARGRIPGRRRVVELAAALLLAGCTNIPSTTQPTKQTEAPPEPVPTLAPSSPHLTGTPDLTCRELDARERNDLGRMNQTHHGVDPESGVVRSAAVKAGLGYDVISTKLTSGQITPWLAW